VYLVVGQEGDDGQGDEDDPRAACAHSRRDRGRYGLSAQQVDAQSGVVEVDDLAREYTFLVEEDAVPTHSVN
jgi:hypothetical protein